MMTLKFIVLFCVMAAFEIQLIGTIRLDYNYIEPLRSFYKFHGNFSDWNTARSTCQSEGAVLFYPNNEHELTQVLKVLDVESKTKQAIYVGMSYLVKFGIYETIDGRPISKVYNKWYSGYPHSNNTEACMALAIKSNGIFIANCNHTAPYVCKLINPTMDEIEDAVATAVGGVKSIIDKQTEALQRQAESQAVALKMQTEGMQKQAENTANVANQTAAALERLTTSLAAALQRQAENQAAASKMQTEGMQKQAANTANAANQTSTALERLTTSLAAALDRQTEALLRHAETQDAALDRLTQAMQRLGTNQAASMESLALSLKNIASCPPEGNGLLELRSEQ